MISPALLRALGAYILWGVFPLYFILVADVAPFEVLAHRVVWAMVLLLAVMAAMGKLAELWAVLCQRQEMLWLSIAAVMLSINWGTYIYAISSSQTLEASLGYFINPLVNIVLAMLFLSERVNRMQALAIGLAAVGIVIQLVFIGTLPLISLSLAFSWGIYGLIKKKISSPALTSLTAETVVMLPLALVYLWYLYQRGDLSFLLQPQYDYILPLSGLVTALPLFLFGAAAKQLTFISLSFLQYITPTMVFLIAVLYFGEALTVEKMATFSLIWLSLAIFTYDGIRGYRRSRRVITAD
ncbi:Protein RarD [Sinobacterium norvegicum]|uniref:Protein RarD n=1 Tax=Sinobacterium norvegicum TaxID=1641715 RepID=A0ABN8EM35_9GAMM|nr:EamA family transporter RarD [Sinobacterium norvegicum]CAH0992319.1 Protein RarD [Sinobacterium norvegicum]